MADPQQVAGVVEGAGREQAVGLALRYGEDDGVRLQAAAGHVDGPAAAVGGGDGGGPGADGDPHAARFEASRASVSWRWPRGTRAQPMSAAPGSESRPVLKTVAARAREERSAVALRVATPTRSHRPPRRGGLAVAGEPAGEVDGVERGVGGVEGPQGEGGAARGQPLGGRQVGVGGEARRQVQRHGQGGAAQPAQAGPRGPPASRTGTSSRSCTGARCAPPTRSRNQR